jgi:hypothetical protein
MQAEASAFHSKVRIWSAEVPISSEVYIALDVLNFALHLANRQFTCAMGSYDSRFDLLYRSDFDAGD